MKKYVVYGKTTGNLSNRIDVNFVILKYYLKWISKPSYMSQKIFDNNLVVISKKKVTLTLFRMGFFGAAHGWGRGGGVKRPPLPKVC